MFWILGLILVGLIAGWVASKIMKTTKLGTLGHIGLGILGSIVGGFVVRLLGFESTGGLISSIVTATLGAILLIALARRIS